MIWFYILLICVSLDAFVMMMEKGATTADMTLKNTFKHTIQFSLVTTLMYMLGAFAAIIVLNEKFIKLNSFIGLLVCEITDTELKDFLLFVQNKLFVVGSYLATETEALNPDAALIITDSDIKAIETIMDKLDAQLPKLNRFIIPGGSKSAARAHICRTVCRRAERNTYKVADEFEIEENILIFLNRLSDFFFLTARFESQKTGKEMYWEH